MNITRVLATPLSANFADIFGGIDKVPSWMLRPTAHFQSIPRSGQYSTLVTVEVEDGTVGYGEAWGLPIPEVSATIVNKLIAPMLEGQPLESFPRLWNELTLYFKRLGFTRGGTMEALAGVDNAYWDLRGRLENLPVSELIGPKCRSAVECYASPIMFKETAAESRLAAVEFRQAGFNAIKIKAGRGVATDAEHIRSVRETVGPDIDLMIDVNGGYVVETAIALARAVEDCNIAWLEEPVPSSALGDYARIKSETGIRVAVGENDFTDDDFRSLLEFGKADIVMPNVTRAGGITGVLKIAALAQDYGAEFSLHGVGSGLMQCASLHVLGVVPNARYFEVNTFPNPLRDRLALPAPRLEGGCLHLPEGPGLGCAVDPQTVEVFKAA